MSAKYFGFVFFKALHGKEKMVMETVKNIGLGIAGVTVVYVAWQTFGLVTWASTLPFSIGAKLLGFGALAVAGYTSVTYGAKKFASLFE